MPLYVTLPPNLCKELKHDGRSVYYSDYCVRHTMKKPSPEKKPYTSMITQNSVNNLIGTDHYSTLPLGYSHQDYDETLDRIYKTSTTGNNAKDDSTKNLDDILLNKAPRVFNDIETAWAEEVDATKRKRGLIYGAAGKEMDNQSKKFGDTASKLHPGFDRWLNTANEYEKEVVHKFMSTVSEDPKQQVESRQASARPKTCESLPSTARGSPIEIKTSTIKKVRIHSPPKSAPPLLSGRSTRSPKTIQYTPPASASKLKSYNYSPPCSASKRRDTWVPLTRASSDQGSVLSSASSTRSFAEIPGYKNVSTQLPHPYNEKSSSPLYNPTHRRSISSPASSFKHSCQNCEACKKKLTKRMLKELSLENPKSCDEIKKERSRYPKTISTYLYQPVEDYAHPGTSFQTVNKLKRGYFIIHPDFVSEHPANLAMKRIVNKKYFGESKPATVY